jgi:ATP-dependent 26S proteasome regulatory subunit
MKVDLARNCAAILQDRSLSPKQRAEFLLASAQATGFDALPAIARLIEAADRLAAVEKDLEGLRARVAEVEAQGNPLQPEVFVRKVEARGAPAALVLSQAGPVVCPAERDLELDGLRAGDSVLVDRGTGRVVARDGAVVPTGEIARLDEAPADRGGLAVVALRDQRSTAHVSDAAWESGRLEAGAEVVYDPQRRFVHSVVGTERREDAILTPASELSGFSLDGLGAPNPVIWRILRIVRSAIEHPEWEGAMQARKRRSFLFWGPSGTGKTATIKTIVNLVADWFEEVTGLREPRLAFCDASTFLSSYVGETEQRIVKWLDRLSRVARRPVVARDGRTFVPVTFAVLEEADGLLRNRGEPDGSGHLFDRFLSLFLNKLDDATRSLDAPIVFIATSNRKDLLDPAARRRFSEREIMFSTLSAPAALSVLEKKVREGMPINASRGEDQAAARASLIRLALHYLYGEGDDQALVECTLRDMKRVTVLRRDLVTGALIEAAMSRAIDESLDAAVEEGRLLGLDSATLIRALAEQFAALATSITPGNIREYAPHVLGGDALVATVRPAGPRGRLPRATFAA